MSNILFVTWDGGGNVAPAVLIAKELQRRGDAVRFLGQAQQRAPLEAAGFAFSPYSTPHRWRATGRRGALANAAGFLGLLISRPIGLDLQAEVAARPVDLVVVDCLLYSALDAAARASLPRAVLVHSLYAAVDRTMAGGAPGAVARLAGFNPRRLWASAATVLVTTLEQLDPGRTASGIRLEYSGPVIGEVATRREPSTERPAILVSLSTTYIAGQAGVLQKILDALTDLPVRVIVTTGPAVDPGELSAPANAELHAFLPHAEVMPKVALVVGHGGHSTTMLALAHDLPLVILPMNMVFDQPIIGQVVQAAGAGLSLPSSSSPAEIRHATNRMLAAGPHRAQAARLGDAIRATHAI
ncbi:MAG: nucleotide disphospho-sugar-binding domain-containing protein, partial [Pseudolysinimonas sp.]